MTARPGETLEELRAAMAAGASADGLDRLDLVYALANTAHAGQCRRSGDPYVTHCVAVAYALATRDALAHLVFAGLLHDLPDVRTDLAAAEEVAGRRAADVIRAMHSLGTNQPGELVRRAEQLSAVERDALQLKAADRLHNAQTWRYADPVNSRAKAQHNIDVLGPALAAAGLADSWRDLKDLSLGELRENGGATARPAEDLGHSHSPGDDRGLLRRAVALLPAGERARWAAEWEADLAHLPPGRERVVFGLGLLWSALTIRADHVRRTTGTAPRRP